MGNYRPREYAALFLFISLCGLGQAFLFAGSRVTSAAQRHQHDLHVSPNSKVADTSWLPTRRPRSTAGAVRAVPPEASIDQQLPGIPAVGSTGEGENLKDQPDEEGAVQPPPPTKDTPRRGTAADGTALAFRTPTTQDLHRLKMGDWVAQRGLAVALVALDGTGQDAKAAGEAIVGAPLAGAVVKAMDGVGGSSVATRVCLLRHRREEGVSEAVEHALLDETINQFLNDGARISQVGQRADHVAEQLLHIASVVRRVYVQVPAGCCLYIRAVVLLSHCSCLSRLPPGTGVSRCPGGASVIYGSTCMALKTQTHLVVR